VVNGLDYPPGATPLDPDEMAGLIPEHVRTQAELDEWEQANIIDGLRWARRQRRRELLEETFVRELHRRMFGSTWRWAGTFRKSDKNIGVDWRYIPMRLRDLLEDVKVQLAHANEAADDIVLKFHHKLVCIHPFANGNGRHARVMADLLIERTGKLPFSWGRTSLAALGETRNAYLDALRAADRRDYSLLFRFARTSSE
jgi:Fic-DOC domain mobile mystery protein B